MPDFDIGLRYYTVIPDGYLDEFRASFIDDDVRLSEQELEPAPFNAMEWVIPTAVAVYVAKPFLDAIIKRAADDFGDAVYPRIKAAIINLAKKLYVRERLPLVMITSQGPNDDSSDVIQFSICSETTTKRRIKFVFTKTYAEQQYETCIDQIFTILAEHHGSGDGRDALSQQIAQLPAIRRDQIFLVYDDESETWSVRDPIQATLDRKRASDQGS
ncbi:MAG: hypothetical protein M3436_15285 [Pseudomonadota bacterium]|nr:hypothetical protein [Pseudomonadota bacterium]